MPALVRRSTVSCKPPPRKPRPALPERGPGPTPELLAHKAALALGADPALTTTPLDLLLARGRIERHEHEAACQYRFLFSKGSARRTPHVSAPLYAERVARAPELTVVLDELALARVRREFKEAGCIVRAGCGPAALSLVEDIAVYEKWMPWVVRRGHQLTEQDREQVAMLRAALLDLAIHFGIRQRRQSASDDRDLP